MLDTTFHYFLISKTPANTISLELKLDQSGGPDEIKTNSGFHRECTGKAF